MFKTKFEVDKHVDNCLRKINNENERNLRGHSFAKLYFNVGDYEQARRYVSSYLSVKPKSVEGHNLLGKCLEKLGNKEAAFEAYKNSLFIDPKQNSLLMKVCDLLSSGDVTFDQTIGNYFYNAAQMVDSENPVVYRLKEKLITTKSCDPQEIIQLLLKELESRPADVHLRIQLLKQFLQHKMIKEAYNHVANVEEKALIFHKNLTWYETCAEVLVRFQRDQTLISQVNWEFWLLFLAVLDRFVSLSLDEHVDNLKNCSEYVNSVFNFDQMLTVASKNMDSCTDKQLVSLFLNHYHAQLYFHLATLIFKLSKKNFTFSMKDALNVTLPILLASYHVSPPDLQSMWFLHSPEKTKKFVQYWHKGASYRCSQTGHILLAGAKNRKSILEKAMQYSTGVWRDQLFKKIFVHRDQQHKMSNSFFVSTSQPLEPVFKLPHVIELKNYDEVAQLVNPDSLHHHIWMALDSKLSEVDLKCFEGLQYSVKNLNSCAAESLNVLDLQAFLYCSTLSAKSRLEDSKQIIHFNTDRPNLLPAAITDYLATVNQSKFFSSAYKMYRCQQGANMGEIRMVLIRGIEAVRCVGSHGLDIKLLISLAEIFEERAQRCQSQSEIEFNNFRAELYWKTAIPLLEKVRNNQAVYYPSSRLFEYKSKEISPVEAGIYIEKGKLFLATQLMKKKEYEKALNIFEKLKDPYASYYQSQIYKHMADETNNQSIISHPRNQHVLLSRARDCLYLTLDRLREPSTDRSHPLNAHLGTEIDNIERLLHQIDPDSVNRKECDGTSDENSDNSIGDHYHSTYTHNISFQKPQTPSTPKATNFRYSTPLKFNVSRQEARPSPERLDAQIRQMMASRDTAISSVVEQNKMMVESHKHLCEELKGFKEAINNLSSMISDVKLVKSDVDELKNTLEGFHNLVDAVNEMKKEINEIKKDQNKGTQLNDEDLYVLDTDYGVDYNINSNLGAFTNNLSNMYPTYQGGRMPNTNSLPGYGHPALYPGLYPNLAYAYGGLGLPQPGALPFVPEQQVSSVPSSYPQPVLPQTSLHQALPASTALAASLAAGPAFIQALNNSPRTTTTASNSLTSFSTVSSSASTSFGTGTNVSANFGAGLTASTSFGTNTKAPPVNVVITSSDPLPTGKVTTQPVLSVTIPAQHIKSNNVPKSAPHNYQIPLPSTGMNTITTTPSILSKPPPVISTESVLSNVAPPIFSAVSQSKNLSVYASLGGLSADKSAANDSVASDKNVSNLSSTSIEEHDPCPDFKPIIPLPDEVPVNTGEELETELFCCRAKLFRHCNINGAKEWKERGVGNVKILSNPETDKVRILMRRDQVHKICANHFITPDMTLTPMTNNNRAYIWVAHDFADEVVAIETFCIRFKTEDEAKQFSKAFEEAKSLLNKPAKSKNEISKNEGKKVEETSIEKVDTPKSQASTLGGFVFTSTPTFKPKDPVPEAAKVIEVQDTSKNSPFSGFQFLKTSQPSNVFKTTPGAEAPTFTPLVISQEKDTSQDGEDSHAEEFVPTAEFKPVVALPELVDVVTGEENCEVLFESRAKLFRYDTSGETKEWKERGIGNIKILKDDDTIRIVMRREQVHKVCCNHTVLKNMTFKLNNNNPKVVVWFAKDFSEGVLNDETFSVRFKTEELATKFLQILQSAQTSMDDKNKVVSNKHHKPENRPRTTSVGEKCKTWECKNCYEVNEAKVNHCVACETPKAGISAKKTEESGPVFSFGNFSSKSEDKSSTSFVFGQHSTNTTTSWGNAFKPAEGSWECKSCYVRNSSDTDKCISCNSLKGGTAPSAKSSSWGNAFKPAEGSWECKSCYVRNSSDTDKCISCNSLKDGTAPAAESTLKSVNLDTPGLKFNFGMPTTKAETNTGTVFSTEAKIVTGFGDSFKPKAGTWECKSCYIRNNPDALYCISCETPKDDTVPSKESSKGINLDTPGQKFTFGIPATSATASPVPKQESESQPSITESFKFKPGAVISSPKDEKFIFGSPQKHDFEFKPRSPRRISTGQGDEESENSCVEEEEDNIYFKPVIPLPDKVEVKTGEEEEDVLYCHRAKLFRFVDGEWKERGLGDVKILRRKDNNKLRVVMRREQILKICLNHVLSKSVEYIPKDDRSWLFHVADYSEGEIVHEKFCLRFRDATVANQFKNAVDDALEEKGEAIGNTADVSNGSASEVELVCETKVTPEEEQEAVKLGLPPKFMSYRQLPDCDCDQCKKDDEVLKDLFSDKKPTLVETTGTVTSSSSSFVTSSTGSQIFGLSPKNNFSFSLPSGEKQESLKELLLKPPQLIQSADNAVEIKKTEEDKNNKPFSFSFNQSNSNKPSFIFSQSPGGLFNTATTTAGPLFSSSTNLFDSPSTTSLFGNKNSSGSSIFSSASSTSIFGTPNTEALGSATSSNTSIFSNSGTSLFAGNSTNLFKSPAITDVPTIFGTNTTITPSLFSNTATHTFGAAVTSTGSLFGTNTTNTVSSSIFNTSGGPSSFGSIFSSQNAKPISTGSLFGGTINETGQKEIKADTKLTLTKPETVQTTNLKEDDEVILKCKSDSLSFAALAANTKADAPPAFSKTGDTSFSFLGAGAPVFGSLKDDKKVPYKDKDSKADKSKNDSGDEEEKEHGANEEYDPHYEPIVPLPDQIVVSTGEENEEVLFNERAKLYRYDAATKEWKERGVGQIKVLHHKENNTYRLLLRREQVHKIVLNQLIVPMLELQPMVSSDRAWMWAGYNYVDDENNLEKLAVRFKNVDLSNKFYEAVQNCIAKVTEIQNNKAVPSTVQNYGVEDVSSDDQNGTEEGNDDDDDEQDADYEDDKTVMFMKRCTLSELTPDNKWKVINTGELQVYYDPELYAARVGVYDDNGYPLSNTLIAINTLMEIEKTECTWKAVEWVDANPRWRTLKAVFSSEMAAQEFYSNYLEGINFAEQLGLSDDIPAIQETEDTENEH